MNKPEVISILADLQPEQDMVEVTAASSNGLLLKFHERLRTLVFCILAVLDNLEELQGVPEAALGEGKQKREWFNDSQHIQ